MKRQLRILIYILMAVSMAACIFIGVRRMKTEAGYKDVEIAVRYNDIQRIAIEGDLPIEDVLARFKELGVTTILAKENVAASGGDRDYYSYKALGKISIIDGLILRLYYPDIKAIKTESRYIVTQDKEVAAKIYGHYHAKGLEIEGFENQGDYFLDIGEYSSMLSAIGTGFNDKVLNKAADLGFAISLQVKNWENTDEDSLKYEISEIEKINNVNTIYFSDAKVPGDDQKILWDLIRQNYKLGFIEFSSNKQEGFKNLAQKTSENGRDYKVIRLHTLEDGKVNTFSVTELMERYDLALKERNDRVFLFKMPDSGKKELEKDIQYIEEAITGFKKIAQNSGYTITAQTGNYNLPYVPVYLTALAGLGGFMAVILFMAEAGFTGTGGIMAGLGIICYLVLLKLKPVLGMQFAALTGSIMFPSYAVIRGIQRRKRSLKDAVVTFLMIAVISFGGVLTTIGVLSKTSFALGLDVFMGVKLMTVAPLILIPACLIYKTHKTDTRYYTGLLQKKISYGALILIGLLAGTLLVYVSRSGNSGTTTNLELAFRQFLDNVLGVRPRTKEILIGYPILLAFLYYGYKERYIIFMIFAVMGPVSLVNTYGHIHTPVLISLIRSGYGILIGIVTGLILIWLIKIINKVIVKWQIQLK